MSDDSVMVSISSQTGLHPDEIARRSFPVVRKGGADPEAVRRYLETLASEVQLLLDREQATRRRLTELERKAAEPPVLDEQTLLQAVGTETAKILQAAHDAAAEVTAKAEARSAETLAEADSVLARQTTAAEAQASALLVAARSEAQILVDQARAEAVALLEATKAECRRIVQEARELRGSVLSDFAEKRRELRVQIEQLRAGRDSLIGVVDSVEDAVAVVRARLDNAEHEARVAAADAGEDAAAEQDEDYEFDDIQMEGIDLGALPEDGAPTAEFTPVSLSDDGEEEPVAKEVVDLLVDEGLAGELGGGGEDVHDQSHRSVDELFARIRAARDLDGPESASDEEEGILGIRSAHEVAVAEADGVSEAPEFEPGSDEDALARRSVLVDPVVNKLGRALKRVLRDDQNLLLEAIRTVSRTPDLSKLLPEDAQKERFSAAASQLLGDAWRLGHRFGAEKDVESPDATEPGARLAGDLATELTTQLRERLAEAFAASDDSDATAESAGAAYREWRGRRIERVAGDYVARAFAEGSVIGAAGRLVRWVVDDEGDPCPDCDDNALAGSLTAGEAFPTGQVHPPVHAGCRCLLVPVSS